MRADIRALVTLSTSRTVPLGNHNGNAAFFVSRSALLEGAVNVLGECGYGETVAVHIAYGLHDAVNHLDELRRTVLCNSFGGILCVSPRSRNINLNVSGSTCVDSRLVHLNYLNALLHKLLSFFFHVADCFLSGKNLSKREECRLQNGVGTLTETYFSGYVDSVNGVELNVVLCDVSLSLCIELFRKLLFIPLAVDEEYAARLYVLYHSEALLYVRGVMAGNEVGLVYIV